MRPIIMQDWITIQGTASVNIVMSQVDWILTSTFEDITFYLECRRLTSTPSMQYETSPARDDALFYRMGAAVAIATGVTAAKNFYTANADAPVSHWTRWKLIAPAALWDVTFRIMASANSKE